MGLNETQCVKPSSRHRSGDGPYGKKAANLNVSSSDESTKSKSDNELRPDSIDTSGKDDSDVIKSDKMNVTFPSDQLIDLNSDVNAATEKTDDLSLGELEDEDNLQKTKAWKYRNWFSLSNNFDSIKWSESFCDLKLDSLTFGDSKIAEDPSAPLLVKIRNYLAEYQEMRGMTREDYTYPNMLKIMVQAIGRCLQALAYVVINIAPVMEVFLHILRFGLDTMIDITNTTDGHQVAAKTFIFFLQLIGIFICLFIMFGFIVFPVVLMTFGIVKKILFFD